MEHRPEIGWRSTWTATGLDNIRRRVALVIDILELAPLPQPSFCAYCWGNGFVMEHDFVSLGWMRIRCETCLGRGRR
jgi:hypothetical protein